MNILVSRILSINLISIFLLFGGVSIGTSTSDWDLITEDASTKVYTRRSSTSNLKEIRIVTQFNSDIATLKEVLTDVDGYPSWVFKCMGSKKIATINDNEFHYYLMTDMPYPVSNRDLVVHTKNWKKNNQYFSKSVAAPEFISKKQGMVRVPKFSSAWEVTPISDQTIQIEYEASTDPGGYLPGWVVNLGITKGPINTMQSLKQEVERRFQLK